MAVRPIDFNKTFLVGKKLQINTLIKALRYSSYRLISLGTGKNLENHLNINVTCSARDMTCIWWCIMKQQDISLLITITSTSDN